MLLIFEFMWSQWHVTMTTCLYICETQGDSKELSELEHAPVIGCHRCRKSVCSSIKCKLYYYKVKPCRNDSNSPDAYSA